MIQNFIRLAATVLSLLVFISGCAPTAKPDFNGAISANWRTKEFRVSFNAGSRQDRSFSYYQIEHDSENGGKRRLVMKSAHSIDGFNSVTNGDPRNWIRIVEASGGDALLIEEEIPNACGPCSNYLWIRLASRGLISGTYLRLPSASTGAVGGIEYEFPKVIALDGDVLTYRYTRGSPVRKKIQDIGTAEAPMPPG